MPPTPVVAEGAHRKGGFKGTPVVAKRQLGVGVAGSAALVTAKPVPKPLPAQGLAGAQAAAAVTDAELAQRREARERYALSMI